MLHIYQINICLLFFSIILNSLYAQGNLKGKVTDAYTGESLIGANVVVVGTSLGAASDIEGDYRIKSIPAGKQQIRFSYIGYETQTLEVEISDNKTLELNVEMALQVIEGTEVEITAQAKGQVAAINQQLTSNTIINVVSEEKIQELPDANAAEAIGRLSGVSLIRSGGEANKVILRGLGDKYLGIAEVLRCKIQTYVAYGTKLSVYKPFF
ncbi:MAG: carboxypeptidase-like regulatory domain-containing protein [Ignavibacteria bacterium]|jgi:hypothetical protein